MDDWFERIGNVKVEGGALDVQNLNSVLEVFIKTVSKMPGYMRCQPRSNIKSFRNRGLARACDS